MDLQRIAALHPHFDPALGSCASSSSTARPTRSAASSSTPSRPCASCSSRTTRSACLCTTSRRVSARGTRSSSPAPTSASASAGATSASRSTWSASASPHAPPASRAGVHHDADPRRDLRLGREFLLTADYCLATPTARFAPARDRPGDPPRAPAAPPSWRSRSAPPRRLRLGCTGEELDATRRLAHRPRARGRRRPRRRPRARPCSSPPASSPARPPPSPRTSAACSPPSVSPSEERLAIERAAYEHCVDHRRGRDRSRSVQRKARGRPEAGPENKPPTHDGPASPDLGRPSPNIAHCRQFRATGANPGRKHRDSPGERPVIQPVLRPVSSGPAPANFSHCPAAALWNTRRSRKRGRRGPLSACAFAVTVRPLPASRLGPDRVRAVMNLPDAHNKSTPGDARRAADAGAHRGSLQHPRSARTGRLRGRLRGLRRARGAPGRAQGHPPRRQPRPARLALERDAVGDHRAGLAREQRPRARRPAQGPGHPQLRQHPGRPPSTR
jgi:hypothetical protein